MTAHAASPQEIIDRGTDWRFLDALKQELKTRPRTVGLVRCNISGEQLRRDFDADNPEQAQFSGRL
jgi:hypothetical protein